MKKLFALPKTLLLLPLFSLFVVRVDAQPPPSMTPADDLLRTISSLDGALFDAYNRCDLEKFGTFLMDDVEFYHDQGGVTLGRQNLTESVRKNICGKVRRELVPGTLQVYPMHGYGAIEMGVHRFQHPKAEDSQPVGEAKFVHLWQYKDGAWKITRVLSYDHHALPSQ
jgi:ketosteroid isomerase-like protein